MGHFPRNLSRWPGGRIPFTVSKLVNGTSLANLNTAIATWNGAGVGIQLVPKQATDFNWVHFTWALALSSSCTSKVGMQGFQQTIKCRVTSLVAGVAVRTWVHEIGHAVGLEHEHQRFDRDNFVSFNKALASVAGQAMGNYTKLSPVYYGTQGAYDCVSIMHYRRRTLGGIAYFDALPSGGCAASGIGGGANLTPTDVATVQTLYS